MKFLVSLLGLGVSGGGVFIGTLQQNLSNTKTEIDKLFEEIEFDIRKFSEKNPMTEDDADAIKEAGIQSSGSDFRRKRSDKVLDVKKSENTLGIWVEAWKNLISNYVKCLYITCDKEKKEYLQKRIRIKLLKIQRNNIHQKWINLKNN